MRSVGRETFFGLALAMVMCAGVFLFAARYYPFAIALCAVAFFAAATFGTLGLKKRL